METVDGASGPAPVLRFACPSCGRKYATKTKLAGKKILCNGCGAGVRVPRDDAAPAAEPSRSSPRPAQARAMPAKVPSVVDDGSGADPSSNLLDELASIEGVKGRRRAEPVLPSRAEVMEQVRQKVAEQDAVEAQKKVEKARKKKKKRRSSDFDPKDTLILVGGVGAFVALLAFLAWGYPDLRFPLGGLLCVIGFIIYLLGAFSLRQLVAEEGVVQALLFRFFPPYQWWFVATRWAETKDFFAFFAAGLVILSIGGAVIKTSDVGRKAEESERAYQEIRRGGRPEAPPAFLPAPDNGN